MKVLFFTDPHIGVRRASHTTTASQEKMRQFIFDEVVSMLDKNRGEMSADDITVCLGDLFDLYSNKEDTLKQGVVVASRCDYVLAGNHDLRNNVDTVSSLQLLQHMEIQDDSAVDSEKSKFIISPNGASPYYRNVEVCEELALSFIPHCFTQEIFEKSLDEAISNRPKTFTILCLHCNVSEGFGHSEADATALYLTDEMQKKIRKHFDLCLVGHEHEPKEDKRIVTLGNFFPVSFGEIGNRYVYWFDTETKQLTKDAIFGTDEQYASFSVYEFLSSGGDIETGVPMVEIVGDITAAEYPDLSRALMKFWKINNETLFAVKNSVSVERPEAVKKNDKGSRMSLPELIKASASKAGFDEELNALTSEIERNSDG